MKTCNTDYEGLVEDVLMREFGNELELAPVLTYPDTIVYHVVIGDRAMVFKAMDPEGRDRDGIALEAWSCDRAREAGVPTPRVMMLDTSRSRFPSSFFVMEKAAGVCLEQHALAEPELATVLTELGSHLRALHEIQLAGFGWLDEDLFRDTGSVSGCAETWNQALFEEVPRSLEYLARADALMPEEIEHLRAALDARPASVDEWTDGRLLHGDLGLTHTWIDPDTYSISGVIDWGERRSGDPAYDMSELEGHRGPVLAGYQRDGRLSDDFEDRATFYTLARAIPWACKWHQRGEAQVIDWVRHILPNYLRL